MRSVMIADRDEDERCLLKAMLKRKGFGVVEAADGVQAIELASKHLPDLLLVDLNLPRIGGTAVIRKIRTRAKSHQVPVVVSCRTLGKRKSGIRGHTAHLQKPLALEELFEVIDRLSLTRKLKSPAVKGVARKLRCS